MNILVTNDDGIHAEGLIWLCRKLAESHAVTVIAPDRERSAVGHCITLHEPLRIRRVTLDGGFPGFSVTGTPADCIKLGILEIMERKPDLVVSGINPGANVGVNLNYSGTVSAAREAALNGIPALAVSVAAIEEVRYAEASEIAEALSRFLVLNRLPPGTFLNVNIPNLPLSGISGIRITRQSIARSSERFEKRTDPRNRIYYWQATPHGISEQCPDMDTTAIYSDYISVTPIRCDMTDDGAIETIKTWNIGAVIGDGAESNADPGAGEEGSG